jgi:hemoglobin
MRNFKLIVAIAGTLLCAVALAQQDPNSKLKNYDKSLYERLTTDKKSLYDQLGGRPMIQRIVNDAVNNVFADRRIAHYFVEAEISVLKVQVTDQICELTGGPCKYKSRSMEKAHDGHNITDAAFGAFVEDFQAAVRKHGIPFELENKLLALLAPMKSAIVYRK